MSCVCSSEEAERVGTGSLRSVGFARDLRAGVGYLAPRSSRHAGKHSDGYLRPLAARVGRGPTHTRGLNLADPLSRLLLSLLTLLARASNCFAPRDTRPPSRQSR
jgi:hypothetical protein